MARGAGIAFVSGGKVLLLKRSGRVLTPNRWNLPGGTAEPGETAIQTATREAREEAGPLPPHRVRRTTCPGSFAIFVASVDRPFKPRLNWESSGYRWVAIAQARQLPLVRYLGPAIDSGCLNP